jgi:hypothetical protein
MRRILKEPLLHFLVLGAAIFVAYGWVSKPTQDEPGKIIVTQGQIEHLATGFAKTHQRPPSADELAGLVRDRVREEVYYREAMALGLDRDDTIIRRRLRQKMEFVSDDIAAQSEPGDSDLNAYLQAHSDKFLVEERFSFRQVYLNPEKHGENLAHAAAQLLAQLNQAGVRADIAAMGDTSLLERDLTAASMGEITRQFGDAFAAKLGGLPPGQWQGPVESAFGVHLVLVNERTEGRLPVLAEVRDAVRREWEGERRLEANETFYQELLERYAVTIEEPKPPAEPRKVAKSP